MQARQRPAIMQARGCLFLLAIRSGCSVIGLLCFRHDHLAASVQLGLSYRVSSCGAVPAAFFILVICWYGKEGYIKAKNNKLILS
jgi:hypothetical protein